MIDLKNFSENKHLFTFVKQANGTVKVTKKRFDENGKETTPAEFETNLEHFDDIVLDNKTQIIQERKQINAAKAQIKTKEAELDAREAMLEQGAKELRKEIEQVLVGKK